MVEDRATIEVYDARAKEYDQLDTSPEPGEMLADFIAALPARAHVLDLGCGPGTSARHMAAASCRVDAWDASAAMIALASRIDGVTARQATFDDLQATGVYDGIWANFSLLHAARNDLPRYLGAIQRALKPQGVFHIAVKEGEGDGRDALGRYYTYHSIDGLGAMLEAAGFTLGPVRKGRDKGLAGTVDPWFAIRAHA